MPYSGKYPIRFDQSEIKEAITEGFRIVQFSPYHYRIEGQLDVWPSRKGHQRFHDIKTGKRGTYIMGQLVNYIAWKHQF